MRFSWHRAGKGESSAVEGVGHKSLRSGCAYQLKLKCALSTRGAKCFLQLAHECGSGACPSMWDWGCLANLYPAQAAANLSPLSLEKITISLAVPLLTHGHGTIYEAFPSETHCKIYFRFIGVANARLHNQPKTSRLRDGELV